MKTLDEVINKFENCNHYEFSCDGCPYLLEECDCTCDPDALHYLKEYRSELSNERLSWDELKQLEGKPVWIEDDEGYKYWVIIESIGYCKELLKDYMKVYSIYGFGAYRNNGSIKAYRKERYE